LLGPFVEDNHWCAEVKRKFMSAREKLFDSLDKNAKVLKAKGIPNHVADQIKKKFEIISESDRIMDLVRKDQNFGVFLKIYFEKESLV
jgi:preprotein translocase subunit YajC